MNDEIIEIVNQLIFKLNDLQSDYHVLKDELAEEEKQKLIAHIDQLKKQSTELYNWFI